MPTESVAQLTNRSEIVTLLSSSGPSQRVLVVEDERKLARALDEGLYQTGYAVTVVSSGEDALDALTRDAFDVVLLDVMLPGLDGFGVVSAMRRAGDATPVLMLTARDTVADRVDGLDAGAADYLVKPFEWPELLARLRALTRRGQRPDTRLSIADLLVDRVERIATRAGRDLLLTPREFDLLAYLLQHAGQVVSRDMLARDVWRQDHRGTPIDNVIDVHVVRLRRKVDHGFAPALIHTIRGLGFVLRDNQP